MEKIEAIIFDLGGVILDIDYQLTRTAFEKLGAEKFNVMYSQASADQLFRELETGRITENNFYEAFNICTGLGLSAEQISGAWNAMLLTFREKSLHFLDTIKNKYRLFLLSNTNEIHYHKFNEIYHEKERKGAFENYFEEAYYSFEIGKRKPDADCYEHVINSQGLTPAATLFIDDSIQNVEAAKMAGMQAILLIPGRHIENLEL